MKFPAIFYRATESYSTYEKHVNAPLLRYEFIKKTDCRAFITVSGLGFYDIFVNGQKITKGLLAPYISNPDDMVYFDRYDITDILNSEKNCIGLILGNGMQNAHGGRVWDFDIAKFRNAPCFAISLSYENDEGKEIGFEDIGERFKTSPSPIIFDDLRSGCFYDANLEQKGWNMPGFDDGNWVNVIKADTPRGEMKICEADPIVITEEIKPIAVREAEIDTDFDNRENMRLDTQFKFNKLGQKGILYDFGVNSAGICRLKIDGKKGQQIFIQFCELMLSNGKLSYKNSGSFYPDGYGQSLYYICKGEKNEIFEPPFCYYGYRYAVVFGLENDQIKDDTLTMLVANSDLKKRCFFECSDETMNTLGKMGRVSDLANFYYFPTDCPHREKNGWTGDAAVSAEHMLLTLTPERSYREWLRNICKAQKSDGCLPGIIPTGGWGFEWGNGPAWDNMLTELCWQTYRMRGNLELAKDCSENILRYLSYISQKRRPDGLIAIGLGDWLQPGKDAGSPLAPLYVTDSVISMYICKKAYDLFDALKLEYHKDFALSLYNSFRSAIRNNLIDFNAMTVRSRCQTSQAICIYYGVFDNCEKEKAFNVLLDLIHDRDDHFDCGMIGVRVIFHVLSDFGYGELAYKMITREDYPSYGSMIKQGLTSLAEDFLPPEKWDCPNSLNHHFMGDITSWFIQKIVGITVNPRFTSPDDFDIRPDFIPQLDFAKAEYDAPCGKIKVEWKREGKCVNLFVDAPDGATGYIVMPADWCISYDTNTYSSIDRQTLLELKTGTYKCKKIK